MCVSHIVSLQNQLLQSGEIFEPGRNEAGDEIVPVINGSHHWRWIRGRGVGCETGDVIVRYVHQRHVPIELWHDP